MTPNTALKVLLGLAAGFMIGLSTTPNVLSIVGVVALFTYGFWTGADSAKEASK